MFLSKIRGLWREGNYIFIAGEYHNIKFHINEIGSIQITDLKDQIYDIEKLPIRKAKIVFLLKSGRKKVWYSGRLTKRKYKWFQRLLQSDN